jgi:hypothetical protein
MNRTATRSGENRTVESLILRKSLVESDNVEAGRLRECRQVGIGPRVRGNRSRMREGSPHRFEDTRLFGKDNPLIAEQLILDLPCRGHRQGAKREDTSICRQPQKSHLSHTAETTTLSIRGSHPCNRRMMMLVGFERERQPEVDVRKMHLLHPGFRRSSRSSDGRFRERKIELKGTRPASGSSRFESPAACAISQLPRRLPVTIRSHQRQQPRHVLDPGLPCLNYRSIAGRRQDLIPAKGVTMNDAQANIVTYQPAAPARARRSEIGGQKSEARGQRSEVRSRRSEVRSQKSEVRSQKSEVRD